MRPTMETEWRKIRAKDHFLFVFVLLEGGGVFQALCIEHKAQPGRRFVFKQYILFHPLVLLYSIAAGYAPVLQRSRMSISGVGDTPLELMRGWRVYSSSQILK